LSQSDRENLINQISKNFKISDIYHDDRRVIITVEDYEDETTYHELKEFFNELFGEYTLTDGYIGGHFHKKFIPQWIVKDHQIQIRFNSGDVDIEISQR